LSGSSSRDTGNDQDDSIGAATLPPQAAHDAARVVTKEFLWAVCKPFFDEMLVEVERRVEKKLKEAAASPCCVHCGGSIAAAASVDTGGLLDVTLPVPFQRGPILKSAASKGIKNKCVAFAKEEPSPQSSTSTSGGHDDGPGDSQSTVEWSESGDYTFALSPATAAAASDAGEEQSAGQLTVTISSSPLAPLALAAAESSKTVAECETLEGPDLQDAEASSRHPVLLGRGSTLKLNRKTERLERAALGLPVLPRSGKGCTMVCHHWKSKGWCRLGENCKFMHPEEKRGVSLAAQRSLRGGLAGKARGVTQRYAGASHQVAVPDTSCSPPTNFVTFSPGGFFSAVPMASSQMSHPEGYFVLTPGF
jgi:hypothetical protein